MSAQLAGTRLIIGSVLVQLACGSAQADHDPAHCLAMAIYWEAKTCGRDDMAAVGYVVLNRIADEQFPDNACAVVTEGGEQPPCQFSWWCDGEADQPEDGEDWRLARDVAAELLAEPGADPTGGARFFHSADTETPWTVERQRTASIGCHVFYR